MSYQAHIQTLQQRFNQALSHSELNGVLVYSGHQAYAFLDDNSLPFKVNPYFKYWLPLTRQQKSFIYYQVDKKPHLFLHLEDDYWHAQPVVPEGEWQSYFDITIISHIDEVKKALELNLSKTALIAGETEAFKSWSLKDVNPAQLLNYLSYDRAYKTAYEIDNMREANRISAAAHRAAENAFRQGKTELETHLAYLAELKARESALPYNNIIAFNENASILHYDDYQISNPEKRLSFLIDAGADYKGYNADISRTYLYDDNIDSEYTELFNAYIKEYNGLLDEIKLGHDYLAFHDSSHRRLSKLLSQFGLVKCSAEEAYEKGYSRTVFPCGTGHYIGLQVHDIGGYQANRDGDLLDKDPRYPFLRLRRPMEANTVFTVEPGIYFIRQLLNSLQNDPNMNWSKINHFSQFGGFRYEDCIAITDEGVENLSQQGFNAL